MPYYPDLNVISQEKLMTTTFLGLNKGLSISDGEMADMENLTGDNYPVLTTRRPRSMVPWKDGTSTQDADSTSLANPLAIVGGEKLIVMDDGKVYVDGDVISGVTLSTDAAMLPKHVVTMGAYVCIFPDKKYINLADYTDCGDMGASWQGTSNPTVTMCRRDGTAYGSSEITVSASAPSSPSQGSLWLDTSGTEYVLKQYSTGSGWTQVATTYMKISASGIGKGFKENDTVWISNASAITVKGESTSTTTTTTGALTFDVAAVGLKSKWTGYENSSGVVNYDEATTDTQTRTVTVSGIPSGAVVKSASLSYKTAGSPYSGAKIRTINGSVLNYAGGTVAITVSGNGSVAITFKFKANGYIGGAGSHSAALEINSMVLTVNWSKTTTTTTDTTDAPGTANTEAINALNTSCILYGAGDDYIIVSGLITKALTLDSALGVELRIPDFSYVTEANNRIWGCRYVTEDGKLTNEIMACALGDFRNWYSYQGTAADSYAVSVGSDGNFTAATTLKGYPIFFKEGCMHRIAGSTPSTFQMVTTAVRGVQDGCWQSVVQVGENLYYKARTDVMVYDGSLPQSVSAVLGQERYYDAVGGQYGDKYYISMRSNTTGWSLFVYDTAKGLWHREDDTQALMFASVSGDLYFIRDKVIWSVAGQMEDMKESDLEWSMTCGVYGYSYEGQKYLSRFNIRAWMAQGAHMKLEIMYDSDGEWHDEGEMRSVTTASFMLPVIPRRCDHCQLRLSGKGEMKLFSIARILEKGGDG